MAEERDLTFPPFRLELANERLWRGSEPLSLRPKAFRLLRYLAEHPERLVTHEELRKALWQHGYVSDSLLRGYIRQLREVLGDDAKHPRFIETAGGRGYRFIAPLTSTRLLPSFIEANGSPALQAPSPFVGRHAERAQLHEALAQALRGERQMMFVSGEPGIGKTAVVDAFVEQVSNSALLVGHGQCIEHHGTGEAYLPMLVAVSEIGRQAPDESVMALLRRYAPSWLAHMPWLSAVAGGEAPQRESLALTRERMLREMAELLEALTAKIPLLLVLEDLHWSDYSTLDLVSMLARRRGNARLLLLITYRPVEVILADHPLKAVKQDLHVHGYCRDLSLDYLSASDVGIYLEKRFPDHAFPAALAAFIHQRTEGNPLFMLNVVDYLVAQGAIVADRGQWALQSAIGDLDPGVPESLRQMIERQVERHSPEEQHVLEAASIAGTEFSSITVAAALERDVAEIEAYLARLARRGQLVSDRGVEEWPDNTLSARYAFAHALYGDVLYHRQSSAQRMRFHRRIGVCLERAYGSRAAEIAAELALHFEQGRDYPKAVSYLRQAAASAAARYANREAVDYLARALTLPSDVSTRYDLTSLRGDFLREMGSIEESIAAFQTALEMASHGAEKARAWIGIAAGMRVMDRYYEALEALNHAEGAIAGQSLPDDRARIHYLRGNIYFPLGDIEGCLDQHEQALACAREAGSTRCEAQALSGLADAYYMRGRMRTAYEHFDRCIELCRSHGFRRIEVANLAMRGLTRSYQNDYQGAVEDNLTAAEMAVRIGDLQAEMVARDTAASVLLEKADWRGVIEQAERGLVLARRLRARRFEAELLGKLSPAMAALGHRTEADRRLQEAYSVSRECGLAYSGPLVLGALALISTDAVTRRRALTEGEKLLREGCVSHNYFSFYKDAMEACLSDEQWSEVERYASALEDYTRDEPLPWSDFLIARARALAAHGRGNRAEAIHLELQRLREQAERAELKASLPAIEKAVEEIKSIVIPPCKKG